MGSKNKKKWLKPKLHILTIISTQQGSAGSNPDGTGGLS